MADQLPESLPEETRNLIQAIDLQIASISVSDYPHDDYRHALADQVLQLQEFKAQLIANPSLADLPTPPKRPAEDSSDAEQEPAVKPAVKRRRKPGSKRRRTIQTVECSTCLESYKPVDITTLNCCGTGYCKDCLCEWFSTALSAKQLPKCCEVGIEPGDYPLKFVKPILSQYKAVVRELEAERKLWCANMDCRSFIKIDQDTSGFVKCPKCRRKTCASCAGSTSIHKGRNKMCPAHLTDGVLESTLLKNKWKRCPGCHVVVEKTVGCNNISCNCGTIFCFRCGVSKLSERAACRCSFPGGSFEEPNEDPVSEDESFTTALDLRPFDLM